MMTNFHPLIKHLKLAFFSSLMKHSNYQMKWIHPLVFILLIIIAPARLFGQNNALDYVYTNPGPEVVIPHSSAFNFGSSTDFTIEFWMKPTQNAWTGILAKANPSGGIVGYQIFYANGKVSAEFGDITPGSHFSTGETSVMTLGTWYHVAIVVVRSTQTCYIYLDGVLQAACTTTNSELGNSMDNTNDIEIGKVRGTSYNHYGGAIDELRIWNVARTQPQISSNMSVELTTPYSGNLILYHKFNQGTAGGTNTGITTSNDAIGSNNGTLNNFALTGSTSNWVSGAPVTPPVASPTISTSGSLSAFTACSGIASTQQSFSVSGTDLSANLVVTAPTGFEVSTSSGSGYGSSVSLTPSSGTVSSTTIYVRLTNSASGTPSGNVACTSTSATTQNVSASGTVNVLPSAPSFGSNYSSNYDGSLHLPTVTVGGGESIVWYDANLAGSVTTGSKNVGGPTTFYAAAKIDATGCESSSRTSGDVTIATRLLTITANPESKTYGDLVTGGTGKTAIGSVGLQNSETIGTVTLTYSDGDEATDAVGAYTITPSAAIGGTFTASNYSITYNTGTLTVGKANLTITANAEGKTYGATITGGAGKTAFGSTGLLNGNTLASVTLTYSGGDAAAENVGTYNITPSAAIGADGYLVGNYNITYTAGTLTVGQANLTITANAEGKTYGATITGGAGKTAFGSTGLLNGNTLASVTLTYSDGDAATDNVGTYNITPSLEIGANGYLASNYNITYTNGTLTVNPAPLTITADNQAKCENSNFTFAGTEFSVSGILNSDGVSSVTLTSGASGTNGVHSLSTYTITPSAALGTGLTNYTITYNTGNFTVWQLPTASISVVDNTKCLTGNSFTVSSTSTQGSGSSFSTYLWSATGASPVLSGASPAAFSYASAGYKTINLTVTDNNGCLNTSSYTNNITVWDMPVVGFTINDASQCLVGNSFILTDTSYSIGIGGSIISMLWYVPTPSDALATLAGTSPQTVSYLTHGDYSVNLTATDDNGCTVVTNYTNNVRVFQHPTASYTVTENSGNTANDMNICTGATVNFVGTTSTYGFGATSLTYQWKRDGANATGTGNTSGTYSPAVYGITNPDDFAYHLVVTDNNNCASDAFASPTVTNIHVYPFPIPSFTTPVIGTQGQYGVTASNGNGGQLLCHSKVVFGNTSTIPSGSIVEYTWDWGDASTDDVVTTADNVKHEFPVNYTMNWFDPGFPNTRYTITLSARSDEGCVTTTNGTKDIKNGPDAVIGLTDPTTQPLLTNSFLFNNLSQNRHPSFIDSSEWTWGDGTSTKHTTFIPKVYAATGNYRVHLVNYTGTGCTDTAHIDLTVGTPVVASFTNTPNTCGSKVVAFTSTSTGATSYSWNFGDGSPAETTSAPSHTYAADGAYVVTLTINGSVASTPQTIYVVSAPVVGTIVNGGQSTCGGVYSFSNVSTGVNLTYAWTFSGGTGTDTTGESATRSYSGVATETVDLVVSADGRCPVSATQLSFSSLAATPTPTAGVSVAAAAVPSLTSKSINNTSTNGTLYYVSLDNAAFVVKSTFPYDITGLSDGTHNVRLVASNLAGTCKDTASADFTINSTPCGATANFSISPASSQALATNKFDFFNLTAVSGFGWISANSWDFGDGTTSTNTHIYQKTYAAAGTYTVTLVATLSPGACTTTISQSVTVTAPSTANFSYVPNTCGSKNVAFTNTSTGGTSYSWNFGDASPASTSENPTHTYAADGSYTVILTINGSMASTPQTVNVVSSPVVGPIVNAGPSTCGNVYTFSNTSTGVNLTYDWGFSGGAGSDTSSASVTRTYTGAATETVDLIVSADGRCSVNATQVSFTSVAGVSSPTAGVSIGAASLPTSTSKSINNTSSFANLYYVSLDGAAFVAKTVFPYDITGLSDGSHTVRLVASDLTGTCKDTATATFSISSTPCTAVAGFNITPSSSQPLSTNRFDFFNTTVHNGFGWVTDYSWDFGDGTTDDVNTFVYGKTYASAGTFLVTLTAVSSTGCTSTSSQNVTVTPSATANFNYVANTCGSRTVAFTSTSVAATTYSWNFGDGTPATTSSTASHTYAADGNYVVILTINGTVASSPQTVAVATTPVAGTIGSVLSTCGNTYTYSVTGATGTNLTYAWSFTNLNGTGASTGSSVTRRYSTGGSEVVSLVVTADARCSTSATPLPLTTLTESTLVDAALSVTATDACTGTRTVNNTGSVGATSYEVSVDGGAYAVKTSFPYDVTGLSAGSHTISLKAINGACEDIATSTFEVGSVTAAFTASPSTCGPTVSFTNTTTSTYGTPTYAWNFNSEGTSTSTSPSYTFASGGTKTVALTATLPNGCVNVSTNASISAVTGSGGPVASFNSLMVVSGSCNTGVQFTSTSTNATSYVWSYGDGTVSVPSTTTGIFHAYAATGTYSVTLTAYGACSQTSTATANVVVTATGNPVPEVSFSTDNATQCITGNRYDFFNRTQLNGWGWVPTYSWDFGDGTTDNVNSFVYGKTYAAAGTYTVTLTGTSNAGCVNTSSMTVVVLAPGSCTPGKINGGINGKYNDGGILDQMSGKATPTGLVKNNDISDDVLLYPNPNNGDFTLGLKDIQSKEVSISIVDMLGREVYLNKFVLNGSKVVDLADMNLAPGTYSLILNGSDETVARKSFAVVK
jgi:PKD repeat protein